MSKSSFTGSNIFRVKKHNLRAILLTFLHHYAISRSQLAEETGLSNTTITNLTAELIAQGMIVEVDSMDTNGGQARRRVGRPRRMLQLVPDARFVVGVHIGIGMFRVAVANLHAEIVHNKMCHFPVDQPAKEVLDTIAQLVRETVDESQIDQQLVLGIGVGASGLVDHKTGVNVRAASLGWHDIPIREHLEMQLQLPIFVDNNVRAMALGEAYFGMGRGVEVLAFIYGRIGVGAGIVVNGQAFRGAGAGAGEIGHTIVLPMNGDCCRCGQNGCLETLVSEPVLLREAQLIADELPESILAANLANNDLKSIDAIFNAAEAGDQAALEMIENQMHYLGIALANLVNVLNPELIILGGMFAQGGELILPKVEATMRKLAFAGLGENVDLQPTAFGWRAGVVGAASLALKEFFYETEREQAILA
jgi:glucokinase-like ROK family protein